MTVRANRSSDIAGIAISICPSRKLRAGARLPDLRGAFMGKRLSDRLVLENDACAQKFNDAALLPRHLRETRASGAIIAAYQDRCSRSPHDEFSGSAAC